MDFNFSFQIISFSILKLLIVMSVGYLLYYFSFINDDFIDTLSLILIRVIFPALIVSKTIDNFDPLRFAYWWALPLGAIAFSLIGVMFISAGFKFFPGIKNKKEFICCSTFQNCGYLPLNIIYFSYFK